jgi:hypothetical protein
MPWLPKQIYLPGKMKLEGKTQVFLWYLILTAKENLAFYFTPQAREAG